MAGKTGTTETDFNPDLSGDQWVIGYTPDVVISQWLGFPKTDENHYLTGTSANEASVIFRNVANSVLPYTDGTGNTENQGGNDFLQNVQDKAKEIVDQAKNAIEEADIPGKAKNAWDTVKSWFGW